MWEKKGFVRNLIVVITFVVTNAVVVNFCCAADLSARKVFEGDLIFNKELPVGLTAGTSEYPELIEIKSVCFEGKYGNSWGIFMDIGWLPVVNSTWKISAELLDRNGKILDHSRDEATLFTCKASKSDNTKKQYVEFGLDPMHYQGRRHAARFKIILEPADDPFRTARASNEKLHTVGVTVVGQEDKKPLADTAVVVGTYNPRIQTLYATDSQGQCEVDISSNKLLSLGIKVQKDGFVPMTKSWSNYGSSSISSGSIVNPPDKHTFEMVPAIEIGGFLQDTEGNAIEGAKVSYHISMQQPDGNIGIERCSLTDSSGKWRIENVPSEINRISIGFRHPAYKGDTWTERRISGQTLLDAKAFKLVEVLSDGIVFTGVVLDEKGQAVPEATVMMSRNSSSPFFDITDSKGKFKLVNSGVRGDYDREVPTIIVEAPGYAPKKKVVDIVPKPDPLEFKLNRGRNIKCHVVDSRGNPLAGGWTVIQPFADNRDYDVWLDDTDSKGDFIIPNVAERDVKLTVGKSGFLTIRDYIIGPAENEVTVQIMRTLTIQGTVTDAVTGKLIPNFGIAAIYSRRNSNERPIVFTDGKYELSFDETSALTWHLQASAVGYEQVESEEFNIEEGSKVINFKLPRSSDFEEKSAGQTFQVTRGPSVRIITGVVKDEKDQPVKNAVISTRPWLAEDTLTNDEGKFRIRSTINSGSVGTRSSSLQETTYILARQKERNLSAAIQLDEKTDNYEITLSPGVVFSGQVTDVNGNGLPEAEILLYMRISNLSTGSKEPTQIDSNGNFIIRAVPTGHSFSVYASADGYGQRYVEANTSEASKERIELEPLVLEVANVSVSGIVVDQFDQPISNIRIYGYGNGQPSMRETYTNTKGQFTLENMCPGQISIQANMQEPERLHGRATARGGDTDIKIVVSLINSEGRLVPREPASLVKKSLPAFENIDIGFSPEQVRDKRILICFWDNEQRPSRNCIQELNKKTEELKQKDIAVVTIHASKVEREYLDNWLKENNISFLIGIIDNEVEKTRFDWSVKALPWLILTDKEHIVQAEGFSINELDERIKN